MIAAYLPDEVIVTGVSALVAWVLALSVSAIRQREKLVRLEEWVRLKEREPAWAEMPEEFWRWLEDYIEKEGPPFDLPGDEGRGPEDPGPAGH